MGKPAVRRSAVPVLYTGHNVDHIAGVQLLRLFAPFLIVTAPGHADKDLSAAFVRLVDVPVVTAAGFKGHIEDFDLLRGDRRKIALPAEILCETVIGRAEGEDHTVLVQLLFISVFRICPDVFCHAECCPCFRPTRIKCGVCQDLRNFAAGDPIFLCHCQMMTEGSIRQPLRHQRCHGDEGTVARGKLAFPAPNLTEKNIIIELCELRRKFTKHISACCNFSHKATPLICESL